MKIEIVKTGLYSYALLDDVFNEKALSDIWKEINFLYEPRKLNTPDKTGQDKRARNGMPMKSNTGVWLNEVFRYEDTSNFRYHQKNMLSDKLCKYLQSKEFHFRPLQFCNSVETLLSYYEDSDYYYPHEDRSTLTMVYWLYKEPKRFQGGNLKLNDLNSEIEVKNNRAIIFPSYATHEVTPIEMNEKSDNECWGRFSFSTFFALTN